MYNSSVFSYSAFYCRHCKSLCNQDIEGTNCNCSDIPISTSHLHDYKNRNYIPIKVNTLYEIVNTYFPRYEKQAYRLSRESINKI